MTLSEQMLAKAVELGLCEEHTNNWDRKWDARDMLLYYKTNPTWCMERKFPPLDVLKKNKDHDLCIYVDEGVVMRTSELCYIFVNCKVGLIVQNIVRTYFSLDSTAKIIVEDGGDFVADTYDNARLEVELRGNARCIVYMHGNHEPKITGSNNYKIRDKRK